MINAILPMRNDSQGLGHYGAPRGSRTHKGIDYACYPGTLIRAVEAGQCTKIGYPYGSGIGAWNEPDPYRYVEITDSMGFRVRYFYVDPRNLSVGDKVCEGDIVGESQDLRRRYKWNLFKRRMMNHVHVEIIDPDGDYINPEDY